MECKIISECGSGPYCVWAYEAVSLLLVIASHGKTSGAVTEYARLPRAETSRSGPRQRPLDFTSGCSRNRHGYKTQGGYEGRHEHGAQPQLGGLPNRFDVS
jgi:hypothetical protein